MFVSPLQGEGRGFDSLSAHENARRSRPVSGLPRCLFQRASASDDSTRDTEPMELFDYGVVAGPLGAVVAVVASVWLRSGWPIVGAILGIVLGGVVGRVGFALLAEPRPGIDWGSNLEGFDWLTGFACVGLLVGGIIGSLVAAARRTHAS